MAHFIVRKPNKKPLYQYHRRTTDRPMYEARTMYGSDIGQARVFTMAGAAKRSSKGWGEVVEIELKVKDDG